MSLLTRDPLSYLPDALIPRRTQTPDCTISAIQVLGVLNGKPQLGAITQLPPRVVLEVCGEGFNDRTVKVRWDNSVFFVFRHDLYL